jgi:hypothetical protein
MLRRHYRQVAFLLAAFTTGCGYLPVARITPQLRHSTETKRRLAIVTG